MPKTLYTIAYRAGFYDYAKGVDNSAQWLEIFGIEIFQEYNSGRAAALA